MPDLTIDVILGSGTDQILAAATEHKWTVIDMAADWATIHPRLRSTAIRSPVQSQDRSAISPYEDRSLTLTHGQPALRLKLSAGTQ